MPKEHDSGYAAILGAVFAQQPVGDAVGIVGDGAGYAQQLLDRRHNWHVTRFESRAPGDVAFGRVSNTLHGNTDAGDRSQRQAILRGIRLDVICQQRREFVGLEFEGIDVKLSHTADCAAEIGAGNADAIRRNRQCYHRSSGRIEGELCLRPAPAAARTVRRCLIDSADQAFRQHVAADRGD